MAMCTCASAATARSATPKYGDSRNSLKPCFVEKRTGTRAAVPASRPYASAWTRWVCRIAGRVRVLRADAFAQRLADRVPLLVGEGGERRDAVGERLRTPALERERRLDSLEQRVERLVRREHRPTRGASLEHDLVGRDEVRRD